MHVHSSARLPPHAATAPSALPQHTRGFTRLSGPPQQLPKHADSTPQRSHMQAPAHMQPCSLIALAGTRKSHEAQQRTHSTLAASQSPRSGGRPQAHKHMRTGGTPPGSNVHARTCTCPCSDPAARTSKVALLMSLNSADSATQPRGPTSAARLPHALPTHPTGGSHHGNRRTTPNTHPQARDPSLTCPSPRGTQHPYGSLGAYL